MSAEYRPVPVSSAEAIAEEYGKSIVIIFAHDPAFGLVHTTTYGVTPNDKQWAAQGGVIATRALGALPELATEFEDYRAQRIRVLTEALKRAALGLRNQVEFNIVPDSYKQECADIATDFERLIADGGNA